MILLKQDLRNFVRLIGALDNPAQETHFFNMLSASLRAGLRRKERARCFWTQHLRAGLNNSAPSGLAFTLLMQPRIP
jgi:hypothetical protein